LIKLGIDAYAQYYWVSRQVDGATPQPVQKMTYDEFMLFVIKQQKLTRNVVTCSEAGAFGFHLHRRLDGLGIKNDGVQPRDGAERDKGVKNDRLDAAASEAESVCPQCTLLDRCGSERLTRLLAEECIASLRALRTELLDCVRGE
jgi:hypothetical protein